MFNNLYLHKYPKNFLIFIPFIFSNSLNDFNALINLLAGFIFFCLINFVIYITNDYVDRGIDSKNKLKSTKNLRKREVIIFNILLFFLFLILAITNAIIFNYWIICYLFLFYLYTFFLKFIKYLDIFSLQSFYLFRLFYGAEIISLNLSIGFIMFFSAQFLTLALLKRIIQIKVNNLITKNSMIAYSSIDLRQLYIFVIIFFFVSNFLLLGYIFNLDFFTDNNFFFKIFSFNIYVSFIIFLLYFIFLLRLFYLIYLNKVNIDIVDFVVKDKITYLFILILLVSIIVTQL